MKVNKDNACLIDIQYIRPTRASNFTDYIYIIWKDLQDGEKHLNVIENPTIPIYIEKDEYRDTHLNTETGKYYNIPYTSLSHVDKKVVEYKRVLPEIAMAAGPEAMKTYQYLKNSRDPSAYKKLREFQLYPFVFGSDIDIRNIYRTEWHSKYDNDHVKVLKKGFLDIEVDIMETTGTTDPQVCPIDLVTLIDSSTNTSYTFALIGVNPPEKDIANMSQSKRSQEYQRRKLYSDRLSQQENVTSNVNKLIEECHKKFDESWPGMEYKFYFYKDEKKMLIQLFQLINKLKLDFICVWNMRFDIQYIIERFRALGLDPAEYMCHPDFPVKQCYFKQDNRNYTIKNQSDFFYCSSYTIFLCQMRNYAAIRKGQSELRRNSLGYIAKRELNDDKLDYSDVSGSIRTFSCRDYMMYILYNIKDVLLQVGIENVTHDVDSYYIASYDSVTPYEYVYRQTMKLRCLEYESYLDQGLITGNNTNQFFYATKSEDEIDEENEKKSDDDKFEGALVGNPLLIDKFGAKVFGKRTSSVFNFSIDMDMAAFYPNTINAMNIDPIALIFKAIIKPDNFDIRGGKNKFNGITGAQMVKSNSDTFDGDVAKECFDNFQTRNYMSTANKWLNFPSVAEIYKACLKKERKDTDMSNINDIDFAGLLYDRLKGDE